MRLGLIYIKLKNFTNLELILNIKTKKFNNFKIKIIYKPKS